MHQTELPVIVQTLYDYNDRAPSRSQEPYARCLPHTHWAESMTGHPAREVTRGCDLVIGEAPSRNVSALCARLVRLTKLPTTNRFEVEIANTHDHRLTVSHALLPRQLGLNWLTRWAGPSLLSAPRNTFRSPSPAQRKREIVLLLCHRLPSLFSGVLLICDGRSPKREVLFANLSFHDWSAVVTTAPHRSTFQRYSFVLSYCHLCVINVSPKPAPITATPARQRLPFCLEDYYVRKGQDTTRLVRAVSGPTCCALLGSSLQAPEQQLSSPPLTNVVAKVGHVADGDHHDSGDHGWKVIDGRANGTTFADGFFDCNKFAMSCARCGRVFPVTVWLERCTCLSSAFADIVIGTNTVCRRYEQRNWPWHVFVFSPDCATCSSASADVGSPGCLEHLSPDNSSDEIRWLKTWAHTGHVHDLARNSGKHEFTIIWWVTRKPKTCSAHDTRNKTTEAPADRRKKWRVRVGQWRRDCDVRGWVTLKIRDCQCTFSFLKGWCAQDVSVKRPTCFPVSPVAIWQNAHADEELLTHPTVDVHIDLATKTRQHLWWTSEATRAKSDIFHFTRHIFANMTKTFTTTLFTRRTYNLTIRKLSE